MAYVIDDTFFIREFAVPNTDEPDSAALKELNFFIDERCRLLLSQRLGLEGFTEFDSLLEDGILPENAPEKWVRLVYGADPYEIDGVNYKWNGLIRETGSYKYSMLVPYVYYFWLRANSSYMTGVGDAKAKAKNAVAVNPTQRLVTSWNRFVKEHNGGYFLNPIANVYHVGIPQVEGHYNLGLSDPSDISLVQFLSQNEDVYPGCTVEFFQIQNQLTI